MTANVYHLLAAGTHLERLREKILRIVAQAIEERGWTQKEAAHYLGVPLERVSNLIQGFTDKFSLDSLVELLFALDKPVELVAQQGEWTRSGSWRVSEENPEAKDTVEHYTRTLLHDPQNVVAYSRRALAYHRLGKLDLALDDYARCLELDPGKPRYLADRALVYKDAGQLQAALLDCEELQRKFPDYNVYGNRGLIYWELNELDKALLDFNMAVERSPERPGPWNNRALFHRQQGHLQEALDDYRRALQVDPTAKNIPGWIEELEAQMASNL